ncbi:MAG: NAD(+)/NADH kinase [Coriobacteriales bacterium]|jgi:diacylglycerol kinase family enzyme|nr:NAD(+)/NADH kinase [Coriobacteriales bacterium]
MNVLIVNNLGAGLRDGAIFDFMRTLSTDGDQIVIRNTDGTTPIESFLEDRDSYDLVVAAGGDGTVSTVLYALRNTGIPVLPFPAGTGNLLATNLDQPDEPFALAKMVRMPYRLNFDLGELSYEDNGSPITKGFVMIAGAGYDASIMESSERLKETLGPMAYVAAALGNPNPTVARFTLTLDNKVVQSEGIAVLVLNFAKVYPDISITHANDARDGLLEIVVIKTHNTVELLPAFIAAFLDRAGGFPGRTNALEMYTSKSIHVETDPPLRIQYDGEPTGTTTPFTARILPHAATLVLTEAEYTRTLDA